MENIGVLKHTKYSDIIRYHGQCLYFQCIPSDGYLHQVMAGTPPVGPNVEHIKFTGQRNDTSAYYIHRVLSSITVEYYNPNKATNDDLCSLESNTALGSDSNVDFYVYVNLKNTRVKIPDDRPVRLENISQLLFPGHIVSCRWLGVSAKIFINDSPLYCAIGSVSLNKPDASDFYCGNIEFTSLLEENFNRDVLSEEIHFLKTDVRNIKHRFWHFSVININTYVYQFLSLNLDVKRGCLSVSKHALLVELYSVIQILKRGGRQNARDISYLTKDSYHNVLHRTFTIIPTIYSSGIYIIPNMMDIEITNCTIHMAYHHKMIQMYANPIHIKYDQSHNNQWRMCWHDRCYLMRDDRFIPSSSSWQESEDFCRTKGGHLVSINSDVEQVTVLQWILNKRRYLAGKAKYGFSTIWTRSWMMFLGLTIDKKVIF